MSDDEDFLGVVLVVLRVVFLAGLAAAVSPVVFLAVVFLAAAFLGLAAGVPAWVATVSYTHLDVYKRQVQLLLGHSKLESTVRYLGIEVDDALEISEQTEI